METEASRSILDWTMMRRFTARFLMDFEDSITTITKQFNRIPATPMTIYIMLANMVFSAAISMAERWDIELVTPSVKSGEKVAVVLSILDVVYTPTT